MTTDWPRTGHSVGVIHITASDTSMTAVLISFIQVFMCNKAMYGALTDFTPVYNTIPELRKHRLNCRKQVVLRAHHKRLSSITLLPIDRVVNGGLDLMCISCCAGKQQPSIAWLTVSSKRKLLPRIVHTALRYLVRSLVSKDSSTWEVTYQAFQLHPQRSPRMWV